jgi:hypothetical protein
MQGCTDSVVLLFQDDLSGRQKPRSFSLSSEHAPPLSPQSSLASSGSGSLDELRTGFTSDACGMRGEYLTLVHDCKENWKVIIVSGSSITIHL